MLKNVAEQKFIRAYLLVIGTYARVLWTKKFSGFDAHQTFFIIRNLRSCSWRKNPHIL